MTIADLIKLLQMLPGECPAPDSVEPAIGYEYCIKWRHRAGCLGMSEAFVDRRGSAVFLCVSYENNGYLIRELGDIHEPAFRAKFCEFLKEHFG